MNLQSSSGIMCCLRVQSGRQGWGVSGGGMNQWFKLIAYDLIGIALKMVFLLNETSIYSIQRIQGI